MRQDFKPTGGRQGLGRGVLLQSRFLAGCLVRVVCHFSMTAILRAGCASGGPTCASLIRSVCCGTVLG